MYAAVLRRYLYLLSSARLLLLRLCCRYKKALKMYYTNEFSVQEIKDSTGIAKSTLYKYLALQKK